MARAIRLKQACKRAGIGPHVAPLLAQRCHRAHHLSLLGHTDLTHARGIAWAQLATQGWQGHREAISVFDRPLAALFGHATERFDRVRADRQAHRVQAQRAGNGKMRRPPSLKALADWGGRGHGLDTLVALCTRLLSEPLDFEDFLTLQQRLGVTPAQGDAGFAGG